MTINELYRQGIQFLEESGKENAGFDARCLMENLLNISTTEFLLMRDKKTDSKTYADYINLIRRRVTGEPLQYILGEWEFMGNPFYVGEGVLIPRPETELLVEYGINYLKNKSFNNPIVFDLCSGSGCIAVSIAKQNKNATVYAIEKSNEAFEYLEKNIELNNVKNVRVVRGDIRDSMLLKDIEPQLILSNPPYIKSEEISGLQAEVKNEPRIALDGGRDGYDFYRVIAESWLSRIKNGAIAVECAENQADEISQMFYLAQTKVNIINDLSGFPRVVTAIR